MLGEKAAKKKTSHNGLIDVMKFVFSCIVVLYHFYSSGKVHFRAGYLGVEFFAVVAGFLFFSGWKKMEQDGEGQYVDRAFDVRLDYWKNYMKKRFFQFFWFSLFAFIAAFVVARVWLSNSITSLSEFSDYATKDIWEILMLTQSGINKDGFTLNVPDWTLSSMLIVEFLILGLLVWIKKPFLSLIMPCSLLAGTGIYFHLESQSIRFFVLNLFTVGVLRIYILTCLGILSWYLCNKIKKNKYTKVGRVILSVFEVLGIVWLIWVACFKTGTYYMFCFAAITAVVVAISFSGQGYIEKIIKDCSFTRFLGGYSMCIYLIHSTVLRYYEYTYKENEMYSKHFEFFFFVLLFSFIFYLFMKAFLAVLPKIKKYIYIYIYI